MTDLRRYKPQTGALTFRRWPNRSTVPNPAAGTPSRSKHSVVTTQRGHVPTRNKCAAHRPRAGGVSQPANGHRARAAMVGQASATEGACLKSLQQDEQVS
jgi:hypothetical protein